MRLLFAYFDFSSLTGREEVFRSLKECELNFSSTYDYHVEKSFNEKKNNLLCTYVLSRREKPDEEQLPEGFWGDRIYNVTALVGENGTGKSTLLHWIIKSIVKGSKVTFPFLLAFQKTDSSETFVRYGRGIYGEKVSFKCPESICNEHNMTSDYPEELTQMKCMLIDNTLSASSISLDESYMRYYQTIIGKDPPYEENDTIIEQYKQLFNRSFAAAIRTNLQTSLVSYSFGASSRENRIGGVPGSEIIENLKTHFSYETYQELRFLFDQYHRDLLQEMEKEGFDVPFPKKVSAKLSSPYETLEDVCDKMGFLFTSEDWSKVNYYDNGSLLGRLCANTLVSLYNSFGYRGGIGFFLDEGSLDKGSNNNTSIVVLAKDAIKRFAGTTERGVQEQETIAKYESFIAFLEDNEDNLMEIFEPLGGSAFGYEKASTYVIDIQKTIDDETRLICFIKFLDRYREICDHSYFITFETGLSSGEKNMLHMMTQFRYALAGPSAYGDRFSSGDEVPNVLCNSKMLFYTPEHSKKEDTKDDSKNIICDTLLLFLDEADLTYHPEWQRKYVNILTGVLSRMFKSPYYKGAPADIGCKDIQIILATHSPLMLGDFPKASTIYLKKNKETGCTEVDYLPRQSSFGQNLYIMLKDDFFMTDTIGEFAKHKIDAVAHWCGDVRSCKKYLEDRKKAQKNKEESLTKQVITLSNAKKSKCRKWYKEISTHRATVQLLPPGIIRSKLLTELNACEDILTGLIKEYDPSFFKK